MVSTFSGFLLTINSYPLHIITFDETWLNASLLLYPPNGLAIAWLSEGSCRTYIKENIKYKRRRHVGKFSPELEHLWLEVFGRNEHNEALVGII